MKVSELIANLQAHPTDAEVVIYTASGSSRPLEDDDLGVKSILPQE